MVRASRSGMGKAVTALIVIVVLVVAFGFGFVLNSKGTSSTTTSSTISTSSSTSQTTTSTTSTTSNSTTPTSSSSTTVSSTSTSTECVFSPPPPLVVDNSFVPPIFTGCLTPGATGIYLLAINDSNNIVVQGVIRTQYLANISVIGAQVLDFTAAGNGGVAESATSTTVLPMPDLQLLHGHGYAVTVVNLSQENSTVTINLVMTDAIAFEGG